jgi:hypothetical protein
MQAEEAPPTYSEYPTELPELFPIGKHQVKPLVNVTELQAHLKLLGAFHELKQEVETQPLGDGAANKDEAWVIFVNRAVYRFFSWASAQWNLSAPGLYADMMPPLDVIMVWHTYLLVRDLDPSSIISSRLIFIPLRRILGHFTKIKAVCQPRTQRT